MKCTPVLAAAAFSMKWTSGVINNPVLVKKVKQLSRHFKRRGGWGDTLYGVLLQPFLWKGCL